LKALDFHTYIIKIFNALIVLWRLYTRLIKSFRDGLKMFGSIILVKINKRRGFEEFFYLSRK